MRISDWSSDVCSSDLYASKAKGFRKQSKARFRRHRVDFAYWLYYIRQMATALQNFVEDAPLERARAIARGLPARLVRDLVADPAVTIADVARIVGPRRTIDRRLKEIGRASCRERGCQYV